MGKSELRCTYLTLNELCPVPAWSILQLSIFRLLMIQNMNKSLLLNTKTQKLLLN